MKNYIKDCMQETDKMHSFLYGSEDSSLNLLKPDRVHSHHH